MGNLAALQAPLVLFCLFVAPIWIIAHYRYKGRNSDEAVREDREKIDSLLHLAGKMEDRIHTLEDILDKQHPNWRREI